jgi:hypothetical protein
MYKKELVLVDPWAALLIVSCLILFFLVIGTHNTSGITPSLFIVFIWGGGWGRGPIERTKFDKIERTRQERRPFFLLFCSEKSNKKRRF